MVGAKAAVAGREREEEVAARVRRRAPDARDAEPDSLREPVALVREQRRVGRGHADDRPPFLTRLRRRDAVAEELADRDAVDAKPVASSVVRLHEHADDVAIDDTR